MKRVALLLVPLLFALTSSGCAMTDDYYLGESVWYEDADCPCHPVAAGVGQAPRVVPLDPRIVPTGGVAPLGGAVPPAPPLPPQTREPDLLK